MMEMYLSQENVLECAAALGPPGPGVEGEPHAVQKTLEGNLVVHHQPLGHHPLPAMKDTKWALPPWKAAVQ